MTSFSSPANLLLILCMINKFNNKLNLFVYLIYLLAGTNIILAG